MQNTDIVIIYILIEEKNVDYSMKMGGGGGVNNYYKLLKLNMSSFLYQMILDL